MSLEERIFNFCIWLLAAICLLILLTSCSAAVSLPTTPTSAATAMEFTVNKPQKTPTTVPLTCTVQTGVQNGYLNLRMGAGTQYAVIRVVNEGEILTVIQSGTWLEVSDDQGNQGYVNSNFCKYERRKKDGN
jgi:uncharacterized protein YgiM (DUF1202 family)